MNKEEKKDRLLNRVMCQSHILLMVPTKVFDTGISPVLVPSSHLSPPLTDFSERRSFFLSHSREQFDYYVLLQWLKGTLQI